MRPLSGDMDLLATSSNVLTSSLTEGEVDGRVIGAEGVEQGLGEAGT